MRRLTEKQAKFENKAQVEPNTPKNLSDNRITNTVILDNDTTVEVFKYLDYCRLAKTSLVSKRFCDLICTHRHSLTLLNVDYIGIHETTDTNHWHPTGIKIFDNVLSRYFRSSRGTIEIFDKVLSSHEYNKWVIRNRYSKQIPLEIKIAGTQSTQDERKVYRFSAYADYKDSTPSFEKKSFSLREFQKFFGNIELCHENWPMFQHFFSLLTDQFVYIRHIELISQNDALNLLTGAISPDYGRLQCHTLTVSLEDNMQNFISWIKGHVRCYKIDIINSSGLYHDDEFVDFFMTGGNCTSEIEVNFYDPCKAIDNMVQKFMDLKGCDGNKVVGLIECNPNTTVNIDALKCDYAHFVVEGNINQTRGSSNLVFEFVNNDIGKKLRLAISFGYRTTNFTTNVTNL
ncbi:hypothetical protein Ddc_18472 [Ditylenchus destructor]|nr:hypothetical protein Ddc_18472 [Ditylenchus destructor]